MAVTKLKLLKIKFNYTLYFIAEPPSMNSIKTSPNRRQNPYFYDILLIKICVIHLRKKLNTMII